MEESDEGQIQEEDTNDPHPQREEEPQEAIPQEGEHEDAIARPGGGTDEAESGGLTEDILP